MGRGSFPTSALSGIAVSHPSMTCYVLAQRQEQARLQRGVLVSFTEFKKARGEIPQTGKRKNEQEWSVVLGFFDAVR